MKIEKSSCKCCEHYSFKNLLISVLAKLWTSGGEGKKFGAEWNGNIMQLDAFSAL